MLGKCRNISRGENMSFEQKVIIVTGAARGIGQEYCRRLAALGAAVIAVDINACDQTVDRA
jgi:NAD(P)-dependent dehydrogenase (short-subunit alcohol dehydrogenase family)